MIKGSIDSLLNNSIIIKWELISIIIHLQALKLMISLETVVIKLASEIA